MSPGVVNVKISAHQELSSLEVLQEYKWNLLLPTTTDDSSAYSVNAVTVFLA